MTVGPRERLAKDVIITNGFRQWYGGLWGCGDDDVVGALEIFPHYERLIEYQIPKKAKSIRVIFAYRGMPLGDEGGFYLMFRFGLKDVNLLQDVMDSKVLEIPFDD